MSPLDISHRRREAAADYALLGLLAVQPMTGYALRRWIEASISHFWSESFGSIYPALARLTRTGWIKKTTPRGGRGRAKQTFAITPAGRAALRSWVARAPRPDPRPRSEFLLKVFYGAFASRPDLVEKIERYRHDHQLRLDQLRVLAAALPAGLDDDPAFFWQLALKNGVAVMQARINWADETLRALSARRSKR